MIFRSKGKAKFSGMKSKEMLDVYCCTQRFKISNVNAKVVPL